MKHRDVENVIASKIPGLFFLAFHSKSFSEHFLVHDSPHPGFKQCFSSFPLRASTLRFACFCVLTCLSADANDSTAAFVSPKFDSRFTSATSPSYDEFVYIGDVKSTTLSDVTEL